MKEFPSWKWEFEIGGTLCYLEVRGAVITEFFGMVWFKTNHRSGISALSDLETTSGGTRVGKCRVAFDKYRCVIHLFVKKGQVFPEHCEMEILPSEGREAPVFQKNHPVIRGSDPERTG